MLTQLFADLSKPLANFTSTLVYVFAILLISILIVIWHYHKVGRKAYYLRKCPGMPRYPFVGNVTFLTNGLFKPLPSDATTSMIVKTFSYTIRMHFQVICLKLCGSYYFLLINNSGLISIYLKFVLILILKDEKLI
jgi:hypothetical protein